MCSIPAGPYWPSSSVVTLHAGGSCVIDANHAGNASFLAAPQAQRTVTVPVALAYTGPQLVAAGRGQLTGTGTLFWWDKSRDNGHGGWQRAKSGVAFTADLLATTKLRPGSFGIQLHYDPVRPQPSGRLHSAPFH